MALFDTVLDWTGHRIARWLDKPPRRCDPFTHTDAKMLQRMLEPADILLVDGDQKVATAIKYLTQSTWSHAALYVGDSAGCAASSGETRSLIEVNPGRGVEAVPLSKYACFNTRICRAVGLTPDERRQVVDFAVDRLGDNYDMRNIVDLARYFFPTPPVPLRWRRRMIAFGSGEPTRAICSTLIAQAFQSVRYPILPRVERQLSHGRGASRVRKEVLHIRHHSLFTPRDFDLSPYFRVVKPTIEGGFDPHELHWADPAHDGPTSADASL